MREYRPAGAYCAHGDPYSLCQCRNGYNYAVLYRCPYGQAFNEYLNRCDFDTERTRNTCSYFFRRRGMDPNPYGYGKLGYNKY
uniref:Putative salivary protein n=1 Tax=Culex tarsalis TaxID=7177 RepID=B8RIV9_CULTA